MVWYHKTLSDQTDCLILEMCRVVRHQTIWDTESGIPVYDGSGGIFGPGVGEREKNTCSLNGHRATSVHIFRLFPLCRV